MPGKISTRKVLALLSPIAVALALFGAFTYANTAAAAPQSTAATGTAIQNDVFWMDTSGNPIYSQGGGVIKVGNTYYWYTYCIDSSSVAGGYGSEFVMQGTDADFSHVTQSGLGFQSGLCLDVTNAGTTNGSPIELWTCNGGSNQQWKLG